jgi:beta-lactamase superfamily II metal-dependent hydrolase
VSTPAITLEVLPAGYGDCLLVSCPVGERAWRMLIDTGPDECYPQLQARLAALPPDASGCRFIDVFVVTHIDHDHIGGASKLLADTSLKLSFGDIWFNAPVRPAPRGVAEGDALELILSNPTRALPWNKAFGGRHAVTEADGAFLRLPAEYEAPLVTLLSPTPARLDRLFRNWGRELARLRAKEPAKPMAVPRARRGPLDITALAAASTPTDRAVANASSIAFLLEHGGASVLLAADATPTVLVPALKALARDRAAPALSVNAIKLSHHGSRANVTVDLLRTVQAQHYIVSPNNTIFDHPDDEALARVLVHGGAQKTLWFNYGTERNRAWAAAALEGSFGYRSRYPEAGSSGVRLTL